MNEGAGPGIHADQRHRSPTQRVIKLWNSLPQDAMSAKNIHSFEKRLDKFAAGRQSGGCYTGQHTDRSGSGSHQGTNC